MENLKTFNECMKACNEGLEPKKTFAELVPGDSLYVWHQGEMKTPIKVKVIDVEVMPTKKVRIKTNHDITTNKFENTKNVIYVNNYDKYSTVMEDLGAWVLIFVGTNEEDFLNAFDGYTHKFSPSDIKDMTNGYIAADVDVYLLSPYTDTDLDEAVRTINNAKGNNFTITGKAIKEYNNDILKFRIKVEGSEKDLDTILEELFADLEIVHSYDYTILDGNI